MRFSLKTLLIAFTGVAVSLVGLLNANLAWAAFFYTVAFVLVLSGIVGAIVRPWPQRGYWVGFALFGGGYFWLALVAEGSLRFAGPNGVVLEPNLATSHLLLGAHRYVSQDFAGSIADQRASRILNARIRSSGGAFAVQRTSSEYFLQVGHSIFTIVFALVGGALGSWFGRRDQLPAPE
jgi:hypothetical protein